MPTDNSSPKKCRFCGTNMVSDAIYCSECEHYQSFWRAISAKLDASSLISLLPLITICVIFFWDNVVVAKSIIELVPVQCELGRVQIAASNNGSRSGVIGRGEVVQRSSSGTQVHSLILVPTNDAKILPSGSSDLLWFGMFRESGGRLSAESFNSSRTDDCIYDIAINVVDFGASEAKPYKASCTCPSL
jgi:hypothetical protein